MAEQFPSVMSRVSPYATTGSLLLHAAAQQAAILAEVALDNRAYRAREEAAANGLAAGRSAGADAGQLQLRADTDTMAGRVYNAAAQKGYLTSTQVKLQSELGQAALAHEADPDGFAAAVEDIRGRYQGLPTTLQQLVGAEIDDLGGRYALRVQGQRVEREKEAFRADQLMMLDSLTAEATQAARSGNETGMAAAMQTHDTLVATMLSDGLMSGTEAASMRDGLRDQLTMQSVLGQMDGALRDGGLGAGRRFIQQFLADPPDGLDQNEVDRLGLRLEAGMQDLEIEANRAAAAAEAQAEHEYEWARTVLENEIEAGRAGRTDIEEFKGRYGFRKPSHWKALVDAVEKREEGRTAAEELVGTVDAAISSGLPLVGSTADRRKAVDAYVAANVSDAAEDPETAIDKTISLISATDTIPTATAQRIEAGLLRGDPSARAAAAEMYRRIEAASPSAVAELPEEAQRVARVMNGHMEAGLAAPSASERVDKQVFGADDAVRKVRAAQRTPKVRAEAEAGFRERLLEGRGWFDGGERGLDDPDTWDRLRTEWWRHYEDAHDASGDAAAAGKEADAAIRKVWSMTQVDGAERLMKYAPEAVFGVFDRGEVDAEWMTEQLREDVQGKLFDELGDRKIRIVADTTTARQIDDEGRPDPSYLVLLQDGNGVLEPLIGADGEPLRWRPNWQSSPTREKAEAEARRGEGRRLQRLVEARRRHQAVQAQKAVVREKGRSGIARAHASPGRDENALARSPGRVAK